jgi:SPP1 family predicted phage head-tail adaptor
MRPEKLRNRIVVQRADDGQDSIGQPVTTWSDVATLWADIRRPRGLAATKADAPASITKVSIRIWYRRGIVAGMRVVHSSSATTYSILAVLPDEEGKEFLDLVCEAVS